MKPRGAELRAVALKHGWVPTHSLFTVACGKCGKEYRINQVKRMVKHEFEHKWSKV